LNVIPCGTQLRKYKTAKDAALHDFMAKLGVAADWKLVGKVRQIANYIVNGKDNVQDYAHICFVTP